MKDYINFFFSSNREIKKMKQPFDLLWAIWILITYIYSTIVFNLGDAITFEFVSVLFVLPVIYMIPKINDSDYISKCFGKRNHKIICAFMIYNLIVILIEIMVTFIIAKSNQSNLNAYWLGQMVFIMLWIGSLPLIYIKNVKRWIAYELILLMGIFILVKVILR